MVAILLIFSAISLAYSAETPRPQPTFSDFLTHLDRREVVSATVGARENTVQVKLRNGREYEVGYPREWSGELVARLQAARAAFEIEPDRRPWGATLLTLLLPVALVIGFAWLLLRRSAGGGRSMAFGRSPAKQLAVDAPKITFRDVAGVDEAVEELHEIKEFLENPKKFQALGARIPKGVLLYGPPGTGKTLLARAVAGEAGVPLAWTPCRC